MCCLLNCTSLELNVSLRIYRIFYTEKVSSGECGANRNSVHNFSFLVFHEFSSWKYRGSLHCVTVLYTICIALVEIVPTVPRLQYFWWSQVAFMSTQLLEAPFGSYFRLGVQKQAQGTGWLQGFRSFICQKKWEAKLESWFLISHSRNG